jgi:hypothetical protein
MLQVEVYKYATIQTTLGEMTVVNEEDGAGKVVAQWFPIRAQCDLLELDVDRQKRTIREDYPDSVREIPVELAVGWRRMLCIRKKELALWIASIEPSRCRLKARGPLEDYRRELLAAADQLFWKHISLGSAQAHQPVEGAVVTLVADGVVYCEHGTPHKPVMRDGKLYIEPLEE